ncbi:MAG: UPF0223 family protein [Streptococcaceae bacterium]|jgi:uncharacterized protein YktA (UPF0223 family)|nr:UPF0223 family protein [Streptococcaceae bacterium]
MAENYHYPLDLSWTATEMAIVIAFFNQVEAYYESKIDKNKFLSSYKEFKKIVPSISQEKQLDREFEKVSGYSTYRALKGVQSK